MNVTRKRGVRRHADPPVSWTRAVLRRRSTEQTLAAKWRPVERRRSHAASMWWLLCIRRGGEAARRSRSLCQPPSRPSELRREHTVQKRESAPRGSILLSALEKATRSPRLRPGGAGSYPRDESRAPVPKHGKLNVGRPRIHAGTAQHQEPRRPTRRLRRQSSAQIPPARCQSRSPRAPGGKFSRFPRRQARGRRGRRRRP